MQNFSGFQQSQNLGVQGGQKLHSLFTQNPTNIQPIVNQLNQPVQGRSQRQENFGDNQTYDNSQNYRGRGGRGGSNRGRGDYRGGRGDYRGGRGHSQPHSTFDHSSQLGSQTYQVLGLNIKSRHGSISPHQNQIGQQISGIGFQPQQQFPGFQQQQQQNTDIDMGTPIQNSNMIINSSGTMQISESPASFGQQQQQLPGFLQSRPPQPQQQQMFQQMPAFTQQQQQLPSQQQQQFSSQMQAKPSGVGSIHNGAWKLKVINQEQLKLTAANKCEMTDGKEAGGPVEQFGIFSLAYDNIYQPSNTTDENLLLLPKAEDCF